MNLPEQLKGCMFVECAKGSNLPKQKGWAKGEGLRNYEDACKALAKGSNLGAVCGYADLVVIDADAKAGSLEYEALLKALELLGATFKVKTKTGGFHYYYVCKEAKFTDMHDSKGLHIGEIRSKNKRGTFVFCMAPGSIIAGKAYTVVANLPIKEISWPEVQLALRHFLQKEEQPKLPKVSGEEKNLQLKITDFFTLESFQEYSAGQYLGPHPIGEPSTTGRNLCIDTINNVWFDFREHVGGGPLLLYAVLKGHITREDAKPGALKGKLFVNVCRAYEKEKGIKLLEPTSKEKDTPVFLNEVAEYIHTEGNKAYKCEIIYSSFHKKALFVYLDTQGKPIYKNEFVEQEGEAKTVFKPATGAAVEKGAVILPADLEEYTDEETLLKETQAHINKYVDISPDYEVFASYYVLLTWVYDALNTVPYLRALGDFSTGKSRFLDAIGGICYRPIRMAGSVTPAPLYRLQSFWKGTLLIDESDRAKSDEADEIIKLLNCGFERGKPVLRCNKDNPNDVEVHDPFGPKVLSSRFTYSDSALESRCLTESMKETDRQDIPVILPPVFYEEQEQLRKKLLMFRLRNLGNIDGNLIQSIDLGPIEKRLKQALSSFAVLFANKPELFEKFRQFVLAYQLELVKERETSFDGSIVNYLIDNADNEEITSTMVADHVRNVLNDKDLKTPTVGRHIKALGFKTAIKRTIDEVKRCVVIDPVLLGKLEKKYSSKSWRTPVTTVTTVTTVTNRNNQATCNENVTDVTDVTDVTGATPLLKEQVLLQDEKKCCKCGKPADTCDNEGNLYCSECAPFQEMLECIPIDLEASQ